MPQAGQQIGPYTLIRELGRGAFKVVWLAEKRSSLLTTEVAVGIITDPDPDLTVIREEAQRWKHASGHPNVLPVLDADTYQNQVVIVSEYAPGGDLQGWLKRHGGSAPSVEAAVKMVCGILAGLEHLHGLSPPIQHRDLKPANILLRGETPMLTDFGVSRMFNSTVHTRASGTPSYMPPEAFDGKGGHLQADIWAVGVILYRLLSGRLPYPQPDMAALYGAMMQREPDALPNSVPEGVRSVVIKAMQKNLSKRYKTATEMRLDLENAQSPKAPAPSQPSPVRTRSAVDRVFDDVFASSQPSPVPAPVAQNVNPQQTVATQSPVPRASENKSNPFGALLGCMGLAAVLFFGNMVYSNIKIGAPTGKTITNPIDSAEMSLIPAGTFTMGSEETKSDNPKHQVTLTKSYYMYQKDVTVAQFRKYDNANGNKFDWNGSKPEWGWIDDHPMMGVEWDDAQAY